jgi:Tol biopolymer transport system component
VTVVPNAFTSRVEWLSNRSVVVSDDFEGTNKRLVRIDLDTGRRRPLAVPPALAADIAPKRSPDGKWLLFSRAFTQVTSDLFVVPAEGGEARRLTFDALPKREIRWTPDGRGVLYRARTAKGWGLWHTGLEGQPAKEVPLLMSPMGQFDVRTGPAGGLILTVANAYATEAIWRAERPAAGGSFGNPSRFISSGSGGVDVNPVISPEGLRVALISTRSGTPQIWVADNEGKGARQITDVGGFEVSAPAWSPDGRLIAAQAQDKGVFLVDAAGGRASRQLLPRGGEPQFSHDARWITFASNRGGLQNLWRVPAGGGPARQLTRHGGVIHRASPDGRWIYFVRHNQPGLWRIPAQGGEDEIVLDRVRSELNRGWALGRSGIYYTAPDAQPGASAIFLYDPERNTHQKVCQLPLPLTRWTGTLSVSRDERWMLFPLREDEGSKLTTLPEVRLTDTPAAG